MHKQTQFRCSEISLPQVIQNAQLKDVEHSICVHVARVVKDSAICRGFYPLVLFCFLSGTLTVFIPFQYHNRGLRKLLNHDPAARLPDDLHFQLKASEPIHKLDWQNSIKTWPRRQASLEENFLSAFGIISVMAASRAPLTRELKRAFPWKQVHPHPQRQPVYLCHSVREVFPWTLTDTAHRQLPPACFSFCSPLLFPVLLGSLNTCVMHPILFMSIPSIHRIPYFVYKLTRKPWLCS